MSQGTILVVDDDAPIRRMLDRVLSAEGFTVSAVADGGAALVAVERAAPDAIVLDLSLPGLDGLAVCRRLREKGIGVPTLMLTARDTVGDRVIGLEAGADDYLVKPFAPEELVARLRVLLRRGRAPTRVLVFDDLELDLETRRAARGGRDLALTAREADLLEVLLRNKRAVVSREQALSAVWSGAGVANVVDRYVAYIRSKLGEPNLIHTVRGVGFTLDRR